MAAPERGEFKVVIATQPENTIHSLTAACLREVPTATQHNKDFFPSFLSRRGLPLILSWHEKRYKPRVTVELYSKWYELYVIHPDDSVGILDFCDLEDQAAKLNCSAYCDHVPNPKVIKAYVEQHDYDFDELAEEIIIGRWMIEALHVKDF